MRELPGSYQEDNEGAARELSGGQRGRCQGAIRRTMRELPGSYQEDNEGAARELSGGE
jgi:hypothetical protein